MSELLLFLGGTAWVVLICVFINIVMERLVWSREPVKRQRDERGAVAAPPAPRHRR